MKTRSTLLPIWLLASCAAAAAAEQPGLSEKDFLGEVPIVLSVSRLPQSLHEAPGAVTIIDRELIRRTGAREIADVLRLVPGFQTTLARGGNPVAAYHGAFFDLASRIQVLVDGRSVYSPYNIGTASFGMRSVSLEDIERIEVLRGSNSATYGARAVLGVINIITRDTADTKGAMAQVAAGQQNLLDGTARIGWGNEAASYRITVDRRGDDGFSAIDQNRLETVNFRGDIRATTRDTIELRAGGSKQRWNDGFVNTPDNPSHTRRFNGGYLQADWRHSASTDEEFRLSYSHNEERAEDRNLAQLGALPPFIVDFSGDGRVDTLEFNHRFSANPAVRISWGGEWRIESARSLPLYATDDWINTRLARLNGSMEWHMAPAWILNTGAMLEHSSAAGSAILPRAMVNWLATPNHTFRAGVSRAHRPPSIFERQANQRLDVPGVGVLQNWLATPGLRGEKIDATELGYYGDWRDLQLAVDVRAFDERISDFIQISTVPVPAAAGTLNTNTKSFINDRTLRLHGVEYQATWRPYRSTQITVSQSFVNTDFPDDGTFLSVPGNTTAIVWLQRLPQGWDFSLTHTAIGAMTWNGAGNMLPSRNRTDLRLARAFRLGNTQAEAAIVVQNAGGASPEYLPQLEFSRRAFAILRIAYH
ncbi:MAG: TonB-dependent receptor plug domain-containing protein [Burkholderiales bacterium]